MLTIEILIAPLRILITALGTGILPPTNPAERLRASGAELHRARQTSAAATQEVAADWRGTGATAAVATAEKNHRTVSDLGDDSAAIADVIESAGRKVKVAAEQINRLIDSFERIATAMGPTLFTPAGLVAILPIAADHLARGITVVTHAQAELQADTRTMMAHARTVAPAAAHAPDGTSPGGGSSVDTGGVAIRLPDGSIAHAPDERAAKAVRAALSQRGVPYVWGGTTPNGFDCSGLTQWAYRQAGLELPRLAQDQDAAGYRVDQAHLQPGDLAVWDGHVAMYVGNNQMVEAGNPVQMSPVRTSNAGQGFQGFFRPR